jgi:PTH1 family peptidyl-tRNA hydrolase
MWLVAGLGNPGLKYHRSRHNVGFRVVDKLAVSYKGKWLRQKNALVAKIELEAQKIILAKPLTYVNNSGEAIVVLLNLYKLSLTNLLVIYDDLDLPLGEIRIRTAGGDGGHKGMRSIIACCQSKNIPRLRIGIGRPSRCSMFEVRGSNTQEGHGTVEWVLGNFTPFEEKEMEKIILKAAEAVKIIVTLGLDAAMNTFN